MGLPKIKSCGVLIVRGKPVRDVLLMKHPTRWDLPKGHVDGDETDIECALRELQEETGICPHHIEIDPDFHFTAHYPVQRRQSGKRYDKTLVIYLAWLTEDVPIQVSEHEGYQWCRWNPPHRIQEQTIDPLLAQLAVHLAEKSGNPASGQAPPTS